MQPFVSYVTSSAWTFALQTESSYDWENEQWSVPIAVMVSKMTRIGNQMVSFAAGPRFWATSPDKGPDGVGLRFVCALLFPK
jgi:hypothetical protein